MYKNVVVIDDSYFDRMIAEKIIRRSGFSGNVVLLDSGLKGIEFLQTKAANPSDNHDVILLDISMPGIDGFAFLKKFDEFPTALKQQCKIFMLSSSVDPHDIARAQNTVHVQGYIFKPLTVEKLEMALR